MALLKNQKYPLHFPTGFAIIIPSRAKEALYMQDQIHMLTLNQLVPAKHPLRKLSVMLDWDAIAEASGVGQADCGAIGFGKTRMIKAMFLQSFCDYSDRKMEDELACNFAYKYFAGFDIFEETPDYSTICKFRNSLIKFKRNEKNELVRDENGVKIVEVDHVTPMFAELNRQLKEKGMILERMSFVDGSTLITRAAMWEERDKAIADGEKTLDNSNISKYAADSEVRIGCKHSSNEDTKNGKKKKGLYWFGFKITAIVDMNTGMITNVDTAQANVPDAEAAEPILPKSGGICGDKGYVPLIEKIEGADGDETEENEKSPAISMVMKKKNMKEYDAAENKFLGKMRSPFERVFSKIPKRGRYQGVAKNNAWLIRQAVAFNCRRMLALDEPAAKKLSKVA